MQMSVQTIDPPADRVSALYDAIEAVDLSAVASTGLDRHEPRKVQAAAARKLFRELGIRGISVTAPNYSMAQSVDVRIPEPADSEHHGDKWPHGNSFELSRSEATRCPACARRSRIRDKVEAILARAFPNHDNRSDSQSDHFDFCWSIN